MTEQEVIDKINTGNYPISIYAGRPPFGRPCGQTVGEGFVWIMEYLHPPISSGRPIRKRIYLNSSRDENPISLTRTAFEIAEKIVLKTEEANDAE